jgi:hypothetical protein
MFSVLIALSTLAAQPVRLHPEDLHCLEFRGEPTVLMTSGEHYGAVLNLDFDFVSYLDELKARGFNLTRTFSGAYFERQGDFKIKDNTLAPAAGRNISPWVKRGDKYDLDTWNGAYFDRLKSFVTDASQRGIVVEYVLFSPFYEENMWSLSPMNARNNVQAIGDCARTEAYTLKHPPLLAKQLEFVSKVTRELNGFDNVYFEVCNEPYFGGVTLEWQRRVIDTVVEAEKGLPNKHMIAQNIANGSPKIENPDPRVSIFNLHYAAGIGANYDLNKAIADDETGFKGVRDRPYRVEAWQFLLDGGAVYSNLDYSYTTAHPNGTAEVTDPTPGGGGPAMRSQLAVLKRFVGELPILALKPARTIFGSKWDNTIWGMADPGRIYVFYKNGGDTLTLSFELPAGHYTVEWIDPATGKVLKTEASDLRTKADQEKPFADRPATTVRFASPKYAEDIAVRIKAIGT